MDDTVIYMKSVPGKPLYRALTRPLKLKTIDNRYTEIPINFEWDGSSVPWIFNGLFPRHRHPIASCRHDWRCLHAKNWYERKWADMQFEIDVGKTSWWITKKIGYYGVRIGAWLGIGIHY